MNTPLEALCNALANKNEYRIFQNQTHMYQILVLFSSNKLNPAFGYETTDELIPHIKAYLYDFAKNKFDTDHTYTHRCVCENITTFPLNTEFNNISGYKCDYIPGASMSDIRGNINRIIHNKRRISHNWIAEYHKTKEHIDKMIYRIFWMLQYYCAYYLDNSYYEYSNTYTNDTMPEYYSFPENDRATLFNNLKKHCQEYSTVLARSTYEAFNMQLLSRIIYDVILSHLNYSDHQPLSALAYPDNPNTFPKDTTTQFYEFQLYLDAFGDDTLDRFHALKEFATKNCFAANELGNVYFFGKEFIFANGNSLFIPHDYKEAIKHYLYAINNSNPPLPVACWSLGYILANGYCSDEDNKNTNIEKAKYYFNLAGNHPASLNSLANLYIKETDVLYACYKSDHTHAKFSDIVKKYTYALELAGKAADGYWFYGNNVIASFISRHKNDTKLLNKIALTLKINTPFDYVEQLKISAGFNNPWAMYALANHYIAQCDIAKAKELLETACKFNYGRAYYALSTITDDTKLHEEYLETSSSLKCPNASYELAKLYYNNNNIITAKYMILKAEQQNLALKDVNMTLMQQITELKNSLFV